MYTIWGLFDWDYLLNKCSGIGSLVHLRVGLICIGAYRVISYTITEGVVDLVLPIHNIRINRINVHISKGNKWDTK